MIHIQTGVLTTTIDKWARLRERYLLSSLLEAKIIALLLVIRGISTEIIAQGLEGSVHFLFCS